jgi:hypothetical protein
MKIKKIIIIIIMVSINWAIGLKALEIPQKAEVIALSRTGIAANLDASLNPASLANIRPHVGVSSNTWYADLKGHKSTSLWGDGAIRFISIETIGLDDIEYHIDNTVEPIGYVEAKWIAFDFGSSINLDKFVKDSKNFDIGYNLKLNYSKLHTERYWGYTFDIGINKKIGDKLNFGFVAKNLGKEYSESNTITIDHYLGIGTAYKLDIVSHNKFYMNMDIYFDWIHSNENNIYKLGFKTNFPYINFMLGSSYSKGVYSDFSYGLSFEFKNWMVVFGSLTHENPALGTPKCVELRKYF